jgi:hypothetical protein
VPDKEARSSYARDLRRRAEEIAQGIAAKSADVKSQTLHELQVHLICIDGAIGEDKAVEFLTSPRTGFTSSSVAASLTR